MGQGQTKLKGVDYLEVESLFQRWKWVRLVRMVNREGAFGWFEQLTVEVRFVGCNGGKLFDWFEWWRYDEEGANDISAFAVVNVRLCFLCHITSSLLLTTVLVTHAESLILTIVSLVHKIADFDN